MRLGFHSETEPDRYCPRKIIPGDARVCIPSCALAKTIPTKRTPKKRESRSPPFHVHYETGFA